MPSNQQTYKLYVQGIAYFNDKKYSDAIGYFKRILRINSSDFLALFGMCLVYTALDDYETALTYANKCLYFNAQYQPAMVYKKKLTKKIERSNLEKYEKWSKLGLEYYKNKNYLKSHYYFEKAYVCNPNSKIALKNLQFIQKILKSRLPYEWNAKALEFYKRKQYEKARVCLKHALSLNPNSKSIRNNIVKLSNLINSKNATLNKNLNNTISAKSEAESKLKPPAIKNDNVNEKINNIENTPAKINNSVENNPVIVDIENKNLNNNPNNPNNVNNNNCNIKNNKNDLKSSELENNIEYGQLNDLINDLIFDALDTKFNEFDNDISNNSVEYNNEHNENNDIKYDKTDILNEKNKIDNTKDIDKFDISNIENIDNINNKNKISLDKDIDNNNNNNNNNNIDNDIEDFDAELDKINKLNLESENNVGTKEDGKKKIRRDLIPLSTNMGVDLTKLFGNKSNNGNLPDDDDYHFEDNNDYAMEFNMEQEYEYEIDEDDSTSAEELMIINLNNEEEIQDNKKSAHIHNKNDYEDDKDKFEYYIDDVYEDYEEPIF
ncbi:tetratricopeptide repeat protein [Methanococcus voltae]|uniref:Tetratricopeptide TPR_2 repeat protein n=1 Tax=Methanococcus voltae (strain ATCC BAA-1334 / A3) TaxID=456320 RepID=D7DTV6_METV3|nr:tetratricopeptide repeat protein [Methanococcus voltae]MCS3900366.1 Flp pilus assembly protein TadD [Methanococcus voltae]